MGAMNELKILDPSGHARTAWDPDNPDEVDEARRLFEALTKRGYRAFRVSQGDGLPRVAFDPQDRETLLVPPIHGG
jgi:hypothetical protein